MNTIDVNADIQNQRRSAKALPPGVCMTPPAAALKSKAATGFLSSVMILLSLKNELMRNMATGEGNSLFSHAPSPTSRS